MNIEQLTRQLRRDEGVVEHLYFDSEGYATVGVGRLIDARKGGRLREQEIDYLLRNDIEETQAELTGRLPWFAKLDETRQGVLMNMAFNLGIDGLLAFKKTLSLIKDGQYEAASKEMLNSRWAGQVKDRAKRLSEQMKTGEWR